MESTSPPRRHAVTVNGAELPITFNRQPLYTRLLSARENERRMRRALRLRRLAGLCALAFVAALGWLSLSLLAELVGWL